MISFGGAPPTPGEVQRQGVEVGGDGHVEDTFWRPWFRVTAVKDAACVKPARESIVISLHVYVLTVLVMLYLYTSCSVRCNMFLLLIKVPIIIMS